MCPAPFAWRFYVTCFFLLFLFEPRHSSSGLRLVISSKLEAPFLDLPPDKKCWQKMHARTHARRCKRCAASAATGLSTTTRRICLVIIFVQYFFVLFLGVSRLDYSYDWMSFWRDAVWCSSSLQCDELIILRLSVQRFFAKSTLAVLMWSTRVLASTCENVRIWNMEYCLVWLPQMRSRRIL
jgi:hypothetical protein